MEVSKARAVLYIGPLTAGALVEGLHPRVTSVTQFGFPISFLGITLAFVSFWFAGPIGIKHRWLLIFCALNVPWIAQTLLDAGRSVSWFVVDFMSILMFLVGILVGRRDRATILSKSFQHALLIVLSMAALFASRFQFVFDIERHRVPPAVLAAVAVGVVVDRLDKPIWRGMGGAGLVIYVLTAVSSGFRFAVAHALVAVVVVSIVTYGLKRMLVLLSCALLIVFVLFPVSIDRLLASNATLSRTATLAEGNIDPSTRGRIDETVDVVSQFAESSPLLWPLGWGHGAHYEAKRASFAVGTGEPFHSVHFGPARMLLRYGLLGALSYIGAMVWIFRRIFSPLDQIHVVPIAVLTAFAFDSLAFNPLIVGPVAAITSLFLGAMTGVWNSADSALKRVPAMAGAEPSSG